MTNDSSSTCRGAHRSPPGTCLSFLARLSTQILGQPQPELELGLADRAPPGPPSSRRRRRRRGRAARGRRHRPRTRSPRAFRPGAPAAAAAVIAPMKSLRETASSSGRSSACRSDSSRRTSTVCAGVLPKSGPGSSISCSNETPWAIATEISSRRNRLTSAPTSPSSVGSSSFCLGAARVCISTSPAPRARAHVRQLGIAQPADVVDDRRAGGDRRVCHRGLVRVDRHERAEVPGHALDQRHHALDLLLGRHRRLVGHAGLAADVDDVGAGVEQRPRQLDPILERPVPAGVGERVGRSVDDAHQPRPPAELERAGGRAQRERRRRHSISIRSMSPRSVSPTAGGLVGGPIKAGTWSVRAVVSPVTPWSAGDLQNLSSEPPSAGPCHSAHAPRACSDTVKARARQLSAFAGCSDPRPRLRREAAERPARGPQAPDRNTPMRAESGARRPAGRVSQPKRLSARDRPRRPAGAWR